VTKYLVIGNGVAGTTAAEQIRSHDVEGEITIVTAEDDPFYYRVRLPDYLGGKIAEAELIARKKEWYGERRINLLLSTRVTGADPGEKRVLTAAGQTLTYDRLLLTSGSRPFIPNIKGARKEGVFSIHTMKDVRRIARAAAGVNNVVIIGGGLLGLETGNALRRCGKKITVVEFFPRLLPRQLDNEGAKRLQLFFEADGFTFRLDSTTREITGTEKVEGVFFENGDTLAAEMVILSAGVRPDLELATMLKVKTGRGVIVDEQMETSRPDIYAAGDVIEFEGRTYGIWPAAMEQGKIAGINMAGGQAFYQGTTLSNTLKVAGIDLASCGEIDAEGSYESKVAVTADTYKKAVIDRDRVIGCIMLGDRKNFKRIHDAIDTGKAIVGELDAMLAG
jgi:nitrite reductase (NADH) large subunit